MSHIRKTREGEWLDDLPPIGNDTFSGEYKSKLDALLYSKLDVIMADSVLPEGYQFHHCDLYNLDAGDPSQIVYSSGIIRYCINGKRQPPINFTS